MNCPYHVLGGGDILSSKAGNDISRLQSGSISGAVLYHLGYQDSAFYWQVVPGDGKLVHRVEHNSQPGANNVAIGDEFLNNRDGRFRADGIAHPFNTDGGDFSAGNADYLSGQVNQRPAAVTGVYGSCGLEEVVQGLSLSHRYGHTLATDNAFSGPYSLSQRIANGDHPLADPQRVGIADRYGGQVLRVDFDDG